MPEPILGATRSLATPLYPSAVYVFPDLETVDRVMEREETGYCYARDGHPNADNLAHKLAELEHTQWAIVCSSGMGALTAAVLSQVASGSRIIASQHLYGRSIKFLRQEMSRFGVTTSFVDCNDLNAVRSAFRETAAILFVETISNPAMRVVDIPALAEIAHRQGAKLIVDNTFATPILYRPTDDGADFTHESLTKSIGGHSDLILGALCGNDQEQLPKVTDLVSTWGLAANPFDCWQCERGMATLRLRVREATANAQQLAEWLQKQQGVTQVLYPGLRDHPDCTIARRLMPNGCGSMLCFELKGGRSAVNSFIQKARGIPFSPSLGHVTTTLSHPASTSHRYESPDSRIKLGISDGLIRLSVGCEPLEEIQKEITRGLMIP